MLVILRGCQYVSYIEDSIFEMNHCYETIIISTYVKYISVITYSII